MDGGPTDGQAIVASWRDPTAFALVFERHFDAVHRYLVRRVGRAAGEEIAAATFLEAFAHRDRFDKDRPSARPWLFGIATNLIGHHYREEHQRLAAYARIRGIVDGDSQRSDQMLEDRGIIGEVVAILAELDRGDRDVLLLYAWCDLSYQEISDALTLPIGTVRSRLHRIRRQIRELLGLQPVSHE